MNGYITSGGIETVYYETRGVLLPVAIERVGGALFTITKKEVISSLDQSNVLIMNQQQYPAGSKIPFNQSITQFRPLLKSYAALQFKHLGDYQFMNSTYQVFVK